MQLVNNIIKKSIRFVQTHIKVWLKFTLLPDLKIKLIFKLKNIIITVTYQYYFIYYKL